MNGHFEKGAWIPDKDPNVTKGIAGEHIPAGGLVYIGKDGLIYLTRRRS